MLQLDTHALVWLCNGDVALGANTRIKAEEALQQGQLAVSSYVFWEMAMLQQKNRLPIARPLLLWRCEVLEKGLIELPVTGEIGIYAVQLPYFHRDPADRIIVASAMQYHATLATADNRILKWAGGLKTLDARV